MTACNLLFFGDLAQFHGPNAPSGHLLWRGNLGGSVRAAPFTHAVDDRQHVAIAAGATFVVFHL